MTKDQVRNAIREIGIIAAVRVKSKQDAIFAAEAVYRGGIPIVEIAMTVPCGLEVINELSQRYPRMIVGAGSVLSAETAQACVNAGARFLTSDGLHLPMVEFARRKGVPVLPGALTPSEVITAWGAGCDFVKVVPCAHIGGEGYVRSLHQMYPDIPLIAAGGVNQLTASQYIFAGAVAVGIGNELIPPAALRDRHEARIGELARRFAGHVQHARAAELPEREGIFVG